MADPERKSTAKGSPFRGWFKNTMAIKLTVLFLLVTLVPFGVLIFFIRSNVEQQFLSVISQNMYEKTKLIALGVSSAYDIGSANVLFVQNHTFEFEPFLVDMDRTDVVYAGDESSFHAVYSYIQGELDEQLSSKDDGVFIDANRTWVIAFYKIPEKNIIVVTFESLSDTFLFLERVVNSAVIQFLVSIFFASSFGGVFLFLALRPINEMVEFTKKVSSGDFNVRMETSELEGEIQTLAIGFNQMVDDIKKAERVLRDYSENLERQVAERTSDLEKSKKELESKVDDLEKLNRLSIGRELRMVELKKRIGELEGKGRRQG
jgi:methyl-accepting chemotaxis protein